MDKKIELVSDRCKRICGKQQSECYVNNKDQLRCISDMIINKTSSVMMALSASLQTDDNAFLRDSCTDSLADACELSNWIKYLQIVPDLQTLSTLVLDADSSEKRTEIRYPLPRELDGRLNVIYDDMIEARLVNFSQKGMQIQSKHPIKEGAELECRLIADSVLGTKTEFKARAMYCFSPNGSQICGARINEVQGTRVFNFFSLIHQFMLDTETDI